MFTQILSFMGPGIVNVITIMFALVFWLILLILPIIYFVYSIQQRRKIIAQLERLNQELCSLRKKFETDQEKS
jgi:cbb3-type cytochrome oxidase subunit 3